MYQRLNKVFVAIIASLILFASSPFLLRLIWPRINDVSTGATREYPDLQPQHFKTGADKVFDAALEVANTMGWTIIESDRHQGTIDAVAATSFSRFKDEVTVTITSEGGETVVNVRSHSRAGRGDLGTNARRIRRFQSELAKRL
jgi:uncharacterized protein (DUF1499 family)